MKKLNLYMYWYGNENIRNDINKKVKKLSNEFKNINFILGPTQEEHFFLMNKFSFYKMSIEKCRYSFAADLYRIWKLSIDECFYMDATVEINKKKFKFLINELRNFDSLFIKENGHLIWNGILYSKNTRLYKKMLNFYETFPKICYGLTGPIICSIFTYKEYGCKEINEDVKYLDARDIDPYGVDPIFRYNGFGSWGKNKIIDYSNRELTGAHNYFHKNALKFSKGFSKSWVLIRWFIKNYLIYLLPIIIFKKSKKE